MMRSTVQTIEVVSTDGTKLFVDTAGDPSNPPVVFCHGACTAANLFDEQFNDPDLVDAFYLIRYDLRAFGRSDKPTTHEAFTPQRFAEDFAAVCKATNAARPIYVGWSFGSLLAADIIAVLGAESLSGVVCLASSVDAASITLKPAWVAHMSKMFAATTIDEYKAALNANVNISFSPSTDISLHLRTKYLGSAMMMNLRSLPQVAGAARDSTAYRAAGRNGFPVLVMCGMEDQLYDAPAAAEKFRDDFTNVEIIQLEGAGHAITDERPKEVNQAILNFIKKYARK